MAGEFASGHVALGAGLRLAALQIPLHPNALVPPVNMPLGVGSAIPDSVPGLVEHLGGLGLAVRVQRGLPGGTSAVPQMPGPVQLDRAKRQRLGGTLVPVEVATALAAPVKMLVIGGLRL